MKLSKYEQETIILYNQAELTASVYTHDPKLLEKLARLSEKYRSRSSWTARTVTSFPRAVCWFGSRTAKNAVPPPKSVQKWRV